MEQETKKHVWQFTNKRKLTSPEFINYFERKVFRTIRKYSMLPKDRILKLTKSNNTNTIILKQILEKKFKIKFSTKPNFSSENMSDIAEQSFEKILKGNFNLTNQKPESKPHKPLYFHSDKEIELYAKLKKISNKKRKTNKRIQTLFIKFQKNNQDLENNIVNAVQMV